MLAGLILSAISGAALAFSEDEAIQKTLTQPCRGDQTIGQTLEKVLKSHSQRDLGWRSFPGNGFIDVERAVLLNKGMELRYRWRVEPQGAIGPENERAERLCEND
jgi:hypothetical protein